VDYTTSGKVQYEIMQKGHRLKDTVYAADVEFIVLVEKSKCEGFIKGVINVTSGKAEISEGEDCWLAEKEG
jgi:hypothetical protein